MPSSALPHSYTLGFLILPSLNHCLLALLNYDLVKRGLTLFIFLLQISCLAYLTELNKYLRTNILRTASVFFRLSLCGDSKNISHC